MQPAFTRAPKLWTHCRPSLGGAPFSHAALQHSFV